MVKTNIYALHHVSVLVSDTQRALGFYRDVLGLPEHQSRPDLGFPGAWLAINATQQLHLLELPTPDATQGRPAHGGRDRHMALWVRDLAQIERRLEAAAIAYTRSASGRCAVFCRDPDGNAVELIEHRSS